MSHPGVDRMLREMMLREMERQRRQKLLGAIAGFVLAAIVVIIAIVLS